MGQKITQVDAFTGKPFAGNPAAVCVLREAADEAWMQSVAREMNLSETAFVYPCEGEFNLRWFTPAVEVALCGHATLATAKVLWEEGYLDPKKQARFRTKSGPLMADLRGNWIELNFPAVREQASTPPPDLLESLGVKAVYVGKISSITLLK